MSCAATSVLRRARHLWNGWWFHPIAPGPLGCFRILFGLLVLEYGLLLWPERALWFSERGVLPLAQADAFNGGPVSPPRLDLLHSVTGGPALDAFFAVFILASVLLTVGLWTRLSSLAVFVGLLSLHNRDGAILNSGDTLMLVMAGYLLLAPAGAACSLDRLRRIWQGREQQTPPLIAPWAQRLMQLQVATVYCATSLSKLSGSRWQNGTAAYFPLHLPDTARFPVPFSNDLWFIHLLTWGTLVVEVSLWTLVWFPRLRLWVLAAGVGLHAGIEYSLNIPLFSALMIVSYSVYLTARDWERFTVWANVRLQRARLRVVYDGECGFCRSSLLVVRYFDCLHLLAFLNGRDPVQLARVPGVTPEMSDKAAIAVDRQGRARAGFYAFRAIAWRLPACWLVAPLLYVPGVPWLGTRAYAWIAAHRSQLPVAAGEQACAVS